MGEEEGQRRIALVLALGGRGDVLPLLTVLASLLQQDAGVSSALDVVIGTHPHHVELCSTLMSSRFPSVSIYPIDSPVIKMDCDDSFYSKTSIIELVRNVLSQPKHKLVLVLINLFSLEGFVISSLCDVKCIIVHPCPPLVTNDGEEAKSNFLRLLKIKRPDLFDPTATCNMKSMINWKHYFSWLWPTLTPEYDALYDTLQTFLSHVSTERRYGRLAPTVLLAVSPALLGTGTDLSPANCIVTGAVKETSGFRQDIVESIINVFASKNSHSLVFIDFGSMTEVLLEVRDVSVFLRSLLLLDSFNFVFICHQHFNALHAIMNAVIIEHTSSTRDEEEASPNKRILDNDKSIEFAIFGNTQLVLVGGDVSHSLLLHRCVTVIHHGGVGTTTACMCAGIPQVVVPLMYDQSLWGDRVKELELGPTPLPLYIIFPAKEDMFDGNRDGNGNGDGNGSGGDGSDEPFITACFQLLKRALQQSSCPQQRLKAGSFGRALRM